jgi:hypothetical protein
MISRNLLLFWQNLDIIYNTFHALPAAHSIV